MADMSTIQIDFDVHKAIETNRNSFAETPNDVLKRMLGLGLSSRKSSAGGKPYTQQGLELPHGTEARMTYNNVDYRARIENGFWITEDGQRHKSPSGAASGVAVTKSGGKTKLDGWIYWWVKTPGSPDFVFLNDLWEASQKRRT